MGMNNVSSNRVAEDLRDLTEALENAGSDSYGGGLGGTFGYGTDYENDVFEMHPFWWGDCECGHEEREANWFESNTHAPDCYQTVLNDELDDDNLPFGNPKRNEIIERLCKQFGLDPLWGSMVHCTCEHNANHAEWSLSNKHNPKCGVVRPNFFHKASGIRVDWYKYIGRSMEHEPIDKATWSTLMDECMNSINKEDK